MRLKDWLKFIFNRKEYITSLVRFDLGDFYRDDGVIRHYAVEFVIDNAAKVFAGGEYCGPASMEGELVVDSVCVHDAINKTESILIEDGENPKDITVVNVREATEEEVLEYRALFE